MLKNKTGFTLIELLVVIAIIGILSGIVITSLGRARASARSAQRVAILRNLSLALEIEYITLQHYPNTCGWNPEAPPSDCSSVPPFVDLIRVRTSCDLPNDYIPLLVAHGVMPQLPHDPQEFCGVGVAMSEILYASNGEDYKIIIHNQEGCEQGEGQGTFGSFCAGVWPFERYWVIQTPGAVDWPLCFSQIGNGPPYTCIGL